MRVGRRWTALSIALVFALVALSAVAASAGLGSRRFIAYYDEGGADDEASAIAVAPDGGAVFITGQSYPASADVDFTTVAYTSSRQLLWVKHYDGPGTRDYALDIAVSPNGSAVIVTGLSNMTGDLRWAVTTVAYDPATGTELWSRRFEGPAANGTTSAALAVSPNGSAVYVTGSSLGTTDGADFLTVAYAIADGSTLWTRRFDEGNNDLPTAIAADPLGGTVFVTGRGSRRFVTIAYDALTGERRWLTPYRAIDQEHVPERIVASPDGAKVFVTGRAQNEHDRYDIVTFALDGANGRRLWSNRFNGIKGGNDYASDLDVSPSGNLVAVTGRSMNGTITITTWTTIVFRASDGKIRWSKLVNGPDRGGSGEALAFGGDGQLIVTGSRATRAALTYAFDSTNGTRIWGRHVDDAGLVDVAIAPDGTRAYLTGVQLVPGPSADMLTIGYSLVP